MGGRMSRNKGKTGERELAKKLTELFGEECRRSQQYCGDAGDSDVVGLPGIHAECKRTESLRLWAALEQAAHDSKDGNIPMVFHRPNKRPWVVLMYLDDLPKAAQQLFLLLAGKHS